MSCLQQVRNHELLENTSVNFKLDTIVEVMVITEETFKLLNDITLIKPTKLLYSPARQNLTVLDQFIALAHLSNQQNDLQHPGYSDNFHWTKLI